MLAKASRMYSDLRGFERNYLSGAIDQFEVALESQEPEQIASMKAFLEEVLESFRPYANQDKES